MSQIAFTLSDPSNVDYVKLLDELIKRGLKEGEHPNRSEYFRKLILKEAKKAGLV